MLAGIHPDIGGGRRCRDVSRFCTAVTTPKFALETSPLGFAKCGVFDKFIASVRNCNVTCSLTRKTRVTPASALIIPGPRSTPAPHVPKRGVFGLTVFGFARFVFNHQPFGLPVVSTGPRQSAKFALPGALSTVAGADAVTGNPVCARIVRFACHPPST